MEGRFALGDNLLISLNIAYPASKMRTISRLRSPGFVPRAAILICYGTTWEMDSRPLRGGVDRNTDPGTLFVVMTVAPSAGVDRNTFLSLRRGQELLVVPSSGRGLKHARGEA